jgi:hypothetical protein
MRGECNTNTPLHPLFYCGKLCETLIGRQPSVARDEGHEGFSYPVSRTYKCKILKFGFSYWIMSPSVGLTFPVSYTTMLMSSFYLGLIGPRAAGQGGQKRPSGRGLRYSSWFMDGIKSSNNITFTTWKI